MMILEIPGNKKLNFSDIVLDYNGTLAVDGTLIDGVKDRLNRLSESFAIHVITADTFGQAAVNLETVNCKLVILSKGNQQKQKVAFVSELGKNNVVALGNGLNDALMLKEAALGIVVIQQEGAAVKTFQNADVVVNNVNDALDLLLNPIRLKATLRK